MGEGDVEWKEILPLLTGPAGTEWFIIEQESYALPAAVLHWKSPARRAEGGGARLGSMDRSQHPGRSRAIRACLDFGPVPG